MVATGMSEREEGMGGGGMRFRGQKSRLLHTHTHMHARAHTLPSEHCHQPGHREGFRVREGQCHQA